MTAIFGEFIALHTVDFFATGNQPLNDGNFGEFITLHTLDFFDSKRKKYPHRSEEKKKVH